MNNTEKNFHFPQVRIRRKAKTHAEQVAAITQQSVTEIISNAVLSLDVPGNYDQLEKKLEAEQAERDGEA